MRYPSHVVAIKIAGEGPWTARFYGPESMCESYREEIEKDFERVGDLESVAVIWEFEYWKKYVEDYKRNRNRYPVTWPDAFAEPKAIFNKR